MKDKKYILVVIAILLAAGAAGWLIADYYLSPPLKTGQPLIEMKEGAQDNYKAFSGSGDEVVSTKIFYPSDSGTAMQEKKLQGSSLPVKMAETVITEYLRGLKEGQKDTRLLGVYRDRNNVFYIDLSDEFRRNFSGDARQEYFLLKALFETVTANITGTEDVKVLIEGKEIDSIGGHIGIFHPLKETVRD